ncbi:RND superfamily NFE family efflux transporter membrane fusion subunit [Oleiphilus messinensis]|uniref:RND superfamily NFE family efflux transporter membrane fusion subunit n=1 Tax=Oleiphilus messinensis TaxID=141451 RepID=A0A1Y0ID00_9GAMM|nr:efflux RND transporter periplasmic adaptor subunit [Oleiphilus messinensis]ARU58130.1 RND superfamily NFE family efflux transporter membrane fusion subunit [Oleiphilus messinensis]
MNAIVLPNIKHKSGRSVSQTILTVILGMSLVTSPGIVFGGATGATPSDVATSSHEQSPGNTISVHTSTVEYQAISRPIYSSGKLVHKTTQTLSFKVSGEVNTLQAEEGETVKAGQILAALDQVEIKAQLNKAKSVYEQSKRDLERLESLYQKKVIPLGQLQSAQTELDVAQANLELAKYNQKHSVIRAPQDGTVLTRMIDKNELVAPHQAAFIISGERQGWIIRTQVSDKDIVRVNYGDETKILFDAYPNEHFTGVISEIAAAANPQTLLFEVEISLNPTPKKLFSGFLGRMEIHPEQTSRVAIVPVEAVVAASRGKAKVFQVNPQNEAELKEVSVAWLDAGRVAIQDGLDAGAQIVTLGATFLQDGSLINISQ